MDSALDEYIYSDSFLYYVLKSRLGQCGRGGKTSLDDDEVLLRDALLEIYGVFGMWHVCLIITRQEIVYVAFVISLTYNFSKWGTIYCTLI